MTIDLTKYRRVIKPIIAAWIESKKDVKPHTLVGELSLATSCPIIVVGYLVAELSGMTPELRAHLDMLETFYRIKEVIGHE